MAQNATQASTNRGSRVMGVRGLKIAGLVVCAAVGFGTLLDYALPGTAFEGSVFGLCASIYFVSELL